MVAVAALLVAGVLPGVSAGSPAAAATWLPQPPSCTVSLGWAQVFLRPAFSRNGRFVLVATSNASGNTAEVYDRETGWTSPAPFRTRQMVAAVGVSDDGRYASFNSSGEEVPGATPGVSKTYRWDRQTGTIAPVVVGEVGLTGVSGDGRYFALLSPFRLDPTDTDDEVDVYVIDAVTSMARRVLLAPYDPFMELTGLSADGQIVAAKSGGRIHTYDLSTSTDVLGADTNVYDHGVLSADGTRVAYGYMNALRVFDRSAGTTVTKSTEADVYMVNDATGDLATVLAGGSLIDVATGAARSSAGILRLVPDGSASLGLGPSSTFELWTPDHLVVTAVLGGSLDQGHTQDLLIQGSGFGPSTLVSLGPGVALTYLGAVPGGATYRVVVSPAAVPGPRTLTASNPSGCSLTQPSYLSIHDVTPAMTVASPAVLRPGQTTDVVVDGTNFSALSQVSFGPGITVNSMTLLSEQRFKANVTVAPDAALGIRTVTATDVNGVVGTEPALVDVQVSTGEFHALAPTRILDTRSALGAASPAGPGGVLDLQVTGRGGVPSSGVDSVLLNVTVTQPSSNGYLTAFPAGITPPLASNLNFTAGQTVPNLVAVKVGAGGRVSLLNSAGTTQVIADVVGWYSAVGGPVGSRFSGGVPLRVLDTREDLPAPVAGGLAYPLSFAWLAPFDVRAVVLNVTVTEPTAPGFLTLWPGGSPVPVASNLNFTPGQTIANLVTVPLGDASRIQFLLNAGEAEVVMDLVGLYGDLSDAASFVALSPFRLLDTRDGTGATPAALGAGGVAQVQVTGRGGVPSDARAAMVNVTAVTPSSSGFFTAWPTGLAAPLASNLNFTSGAVVPNLAAITLGSGGRMSLLNSAGFTHAVADVVGYFR